jgi:hypothetical protein
MDSAALTLAQCKKIGERFIPTTAYLLKLQNRMLETGFPRDDPLYRKVTDALEAMRALAMDLHRREYTKGAADLGERTH